MILAYIRGTCIIKKRFRIGVFVNNTAVGISSLKFHPGMKKSTHHLVPRMTRRIYATWRPYGPPGQCDHPRPPGPHSKPIARTSSTTKWGISRHKDLIYDTNMKKYDTGGADTIVHGGVDGLALEGIT